MAGPNGAAAQATLLLILQIWESFINAKYMKEAGQYDAKRCPTCSSSKLCNNYFCLECKTGGLCPAAFRGDNEHRHHPWLQVRQYSRRDSVLSTSLAHFMSKEGLKHIHTNKLNGNERHCYLKSKQTAGPSSPTRSTPARAGRERSCEGCMSTIRGSKHSTETFLVCSLQCLLKVARKRPALNLLAMNDGAMDPMEAPLFYIEKTLPSSRMLKTPTETPADKVPPPPQATRDPLVLVSHEAPTEELAVEAPPLLPATGDFQLFERHEGLDQLEAMLTAVPFPFQVDDYPMFGTSAEASFEEALPFPPATEDFPDFPDFPVFDTPAEASFGEALSFLPFSPANEDFPDFPVFDIPTEASFGGEALSFLPFPPATEDFLEFPMFGISAAATEDFPDYPMFDTPTETTFGEAHPVAPATEDFLEFPMFDTPAEASFEEALPVPVAPSTEERLEADPTVPADAFELETFALPLEYEALDFGPEWAEEIWRLAGLWPLESSSVPPEFQELAEKMWI